MDEDNKGVATLGILAVMILVYSLLALMYHDARAIQYILFFRRIYLDLGINLHRICINHAYIILSYGYKSICQKAQMSRMWDSGQYDVSQMPQV